MIFLLLVLQLNPAGINFIAPAIHNELFFDGTPKVKEYILDISEVGSGLKVLSLNIGKPILITGTDPDSPGEIDIDIPQIMTLPSGTYFLTVKTVTDNCLVTIYPECIPWVTSGGSILFDIQQPNGGLFAPVNVVVK
jgi:hypothetical protein